MSAKAATLLSPQDLTSWKTQDPSHAGQPMSVSCCKKQGLQCLHQGQCMPGHCMTCKVSCCLLLWTVSWLQLGRAAKVLSRTIYAAAALRPTASLSACLHAWPSLSFGHNPRLCVFLDSMPHGGAMLLQAAHC